VKPNFKSFFLVIAGARFNRAKHWTCSAPTALDPAQRQRYQPMHEELCALGCRADLEREAGLDAQLQDVDQQLFGRLWAFGPHGRLAARSTFVAIKGMHAPEINSLNV
jgi:hypothetical protein